MQHGAKRMHDFSIICLNNSGIKKMKQWKFFNSVFSYGKFRYSSLTYFLVFVVLYLNLNEKLTKCMKAHFVLLVHWNESGDVTNLVT